MIRSLLLAGTALAVLHPASASAQCLPDPADPASVECGPGIDADGFESDAAALTLRVVPGASVETPGDALKVEADGFRVVNGGTIDAGDEAITGGANLLVENAGTIVSGDKAVDADDLPGGRVVNAGTIDAADKAIRFGDGDGASLLNQAGGTILSGDEGFEAGDGARVDLRAGSSIVAGDDAIQVGEKAVIQVRAGASAVSTGGDGIDVDSGSVVVDGTLRSEAPDEAGIDVDAATGDLFVFVGATGSVSGATGIGVETGGGADPANTARQVLTIFGELMGGGLAADLGAGDDRLVLLGSNASIAGGIALGEGNDTLRFGNLTAGAVAGSLFDGGAGRDSVTFDSATSDLGMVSFMEGVARLAFAGTGDGSLQDGFFTGIELFRFTDGDFFVTADGVLAPVPLPAAGWLLVAGLGGLALRRRPAGA